MKSLDLAKYFAAIQFMDGTVEIYGFENGLTTDDYEFDCTYLGLNADNDYLFHLDLSDIIKYLMRNFDGTLKPDDLDMKSAHGLTLFDEYFLDWSAGTIATLYFEKGTVNEVTEALEPTFIYLSGQLPRSSGFNLYDVLFNENLLPLKWSATTYNAIFICLRADKYKVHLSSRHVLRMRCRHRSANGLFCLYRLISC